MFDGFIEALETVVSWVLYRLHHSYLLASHITWDDRNVLTNKLIPIVSTLFACSLGAAEVLPLDEQLRADREALVALLERPAPQDEVTRVLTEVQANEGQTGLPVIFWLRLGVAPVLEQWSVADGARDCLVAFNEGLKARGIHLIVVPVPTSVTTHTHRLSDQIRPDQDLMPGYTRGLIELIDAGIEVVDLRQAFAEAADPHANPLMNRADFHWAPGGVALATEHLAPRLSRLEGIRSQESRPQDWSLGSKLVEQPDMSLNRGNRLWSDRGGMMYETKAEALRANNIPEQEEVIWFTYEGEHSLRGYRAWGPGRGGPLDHAFIVIGDSQARQNSRRGRSPIDGAGLINQLAARLGILGTVFSMNGDVDRVPAAFTEERVSDLTQTQAVILVGRMGDFCQGGWRLPEFPGADNQAAPASAVEGRFHVVLSEVAELPDPEAADYNDALVTAVATITRGPRSGESIKVLTVGMRDRELVPALRRWRNGARLQLDISSWSAKREAEPALSAIEIIDEVEDLLMAEHWADLVGR